MGARFKALSQKGRKSTGSLCGLHIRDSCDCRVPVPGGTDSKSGEIKCIGTGPKDVSVSHCGLSSHPAPHFSTPGSPGNNLNSELMLQGKTQLSIREKKDIRGYLAQSLPFLHYTLTVINGRATRMFCLCFSKRSAYH